MRSLLLWAVLALLPTMTACPPSPVNPPPDADGAGPPTPPTPATDASGDCAAACAALKGAGCTLGSQDTCGTFMSTVDGTLREPGGPALRCADVAKITTRAQAQALGFVCSP